MTITLNHDEEIHGPRHYAGVEGWLSDSCKECALLARHPIRVTGVVSDVSCVACLNAIEDTLTDVYEVSHDAGIALAREIELANDRIEASLRQQTGWKKP